MRWPFLYISIGLGRHPLARAYKTLLSGKKKENEPISQESKKHNKSEKGIEEGYHGKAVPLSTAIELVSIKEDISLENLEQVIPFERARDIVIKKPAEDCGFGLSLPKGSNKSLLPIGCLFDHWRSICKLCPGTSSQNITRDQRQ